MPPTPATASRILIFMDRFADFIDALSDAELYALSGALLARRCTVPAMIVARYAGVIEVSRLAHHGKPRPETVAAEWEREMNDEVGDDDEAPCF